MIDQEDIFDFLGITRNGTSGGKEPTIAKQSLLDILGRNLGLAPERVVFIIVDIGDAQDLALVGHV